MNQEEFVNRVVKDLVRGTALRVLKQNLAQNVDNSAYPETVNNAIGWYSSLDDKNKVFVLSIAKVAIHSTIFRVLACLDGVKRIDDEDGFLSLSYKTEDGKNDSLLADPEAKSLLHDLYMEDFPEWLAEEPLIEE